MPHTPHTHTALHDAIRPLTAGVLLLGLGVIVAACGGSASAAEGRVTRSVVTLVAEDLAIVERRELAVGSIITGTLTARRHATVRAEVGGAVTATFADRGMAVAAGTPLLRIEDRAPRDAPAAALSDVRTDQDGLALAKRRLTRAEALLAGGAVSVEETEEARQAFTSAESRLAASRARLSTAADALGRTVVRAPFAGVVSARPVNTGEIVAPGTELFEVLDPTTMYLESSVPSAELGAIAIGTPVTFSVTGYPGRTFTGRVERVNPAADPTTRQIPVFISIRNGDGRLVAGLFAEGRVAPNDGPGLFVPGAAVERIDDTAAVVRFANGHIERTPVEIGRQDADGALIEIRSGLAAGDTVLLGVSRSLPTGTAARVAGPAAVTPIAR